MIPRSDVPRSTFRRDSGLKTTFDAGKLIPIYCEEVLPGDSFNVTLNAVIRMATPIFPIMDNLHFDTFFFFVPNRLVWDNWRRMMGEQRNPGDSIDFRVPTITSPVGGYDPCSIYDYFGLPTVGQVDPTGQVTHSALPLRAYNLIYNEWFRDENLIDSVPVNVSDGLLGADIEDPALYTLLSRGKRHDYFTSCLPWPNKGTEVGFGLVDSQAPVFMNPGSSAVLPVRGDGQPIGIFPVGQNPPVAGQFMGGQTPVEGGSNVFYNLPLTSDFPLGLNVNSASHVQVRSSDLASFFNGANVYADLDLATQQTINQLRMAFQVQKLLERDARGGTRYTEILLSHFGVRSPDARLQRPEYLGGGSSAILTQPVPQTSASDAISPQGNLAGYTAALARGHSFSSAFVEHGYIIGLAMVRADLTYQQGLSRHWSRQTRYDYYFPVFAALGEQAVLNQEIYATGLGTVDDNGVGTLDKAVFGYQERWAEYRYSPSRITGLFRSTTAGTIDSWHLAQRFISAPLLNSEFISEDVPIARVVAAGDLAEGQQFIMDAVFSSVCARPMPMYSVPGLIDHF